MRARRCDGVRGVLAPARRSASTRVSSSFNVFRILCRPLELFLVLRKPGQFQRFMCPFAPEPCGPSRGDRDPPQVEQQQLHELRELVREIYDARQPTPGASRVRTTCAQCPRGPRPPTCATSAQAIADARHAGIFECADQASGARRVFLGRHGRMLTARALPYSGVASNSNVTHKPTFSHGSDRARTYRRQPTAESRSTSPCRLGACVGLVRTRVRASADGAAEWSLRTLNLGRSAFNSRLDDLHAHSVLETWTPGPILEFVRHEVSRRQRAGWSHLPIMNKDFASRPVLQRTNEANRRSLLHRTTRPRNRGAVVSPEPPGGADDIVLEVRRALGEQREHIAPVEHSRAAADPCARQLAALGEQPDHRGGQSEDPPRVRGGERFLVLVERCRRRMEHEALSVRANSFYRD